MTHQELGWAIQDALHQKAWQVEMSAAGVTLILFPNTAKEISIDVSRNRIPPSGTPLLQAESLTGIDYTLKELLDRLPDKLPSASLQAETNDRLQSIIHMLRARRAGE